MERFFIRLPDQDLAYLPEGTVHFDDYVRAVGWAQDYAMKNRELMMANVVAALRASGDLPPFEAEVEAVNCHHKSIEDVMRAQRDLVDVVHTLRQVVCVKG